MTISNGRLLILDPFSCQKTKLKEIFFKMQNIFKLKGIVQHYSWGGLEYIPELINISNSTKQPFAELWLGAHKNAPSIIPDKKATLLAMIEKSPEKILGQKTATQFSNKLPYLFKILDARDMLSIQVHPSKEQAEKGYHMENQKNIDLTAENRNYKDDNHKPEVHVALTDFWMLHGFRPLSEIRNILSIPEFNPLLSIFLKKGIKELYKEIMIMPQQQVDDILSPLIKRCEELERANKLDKDIPEYWAVRAAQTFPLPQGHRDRGIFSIFLFNLLHLKPGESTFQDAGIPHAYLFGTTIELMANSDNVLRGGLTSKYIDVEELIKTVKYDTSFPSIIKGENISSFEKVYSTCAQDFQLSRIELGKRKVLTYQNHGPDILIILTGTIIIRCDHEKKQFHKGEAFFVTAATNYELFAQESSVLYRASVP